MSNKNDVVVKKPKAMILNYDTLKRMAFEIERDRLNKDGLKYMKYTKEELFELLEKPDKNEKKLRELSNHLYITNSNYRNTINLHRDLLLFYYMVSINEKQNLQDIDREEFLKDYKEVLSYFDNMNIPHEMRKILDVALKEDVFYGYEISTDDSYYIMRLNPDNCRISSVEDGVYNFEFNFGFFDASKKNKELLDSYPPEFKAKYNQLKKKKTKPSDMWDELNSRNTICIKINENIDYIIPPFITLYEDIYDIEDYKTLKKAKEEMFGYQLLVEKIPINSNSTNTNDFLVELDDALEFHSLAASTLPDQIGLMISPLDIEPIQFKQETVDRDNVGKAIRDYFTNAGINQLIFNSEDGGTIGLNRNLETIEAFMFTVLRQIERWFNRKLKFLNTKYKYSFKFFDITQYNKDKFRESKLEPAKYGIPVKQDACIAFGMKQSEIVNAAYMENEILGLNDLFIPLQSTHTQSGKEGAGREQKDEIDLSDSGIQTKDTGANDNRAT